MPLEATTAIGLPKTPVGISGFDEITQGGLPTGRPSLFSGAAGCGKTLFAVTFLVNGATKYNEPGVFMSFEERAEDVAANVTSLGYNLSGLVADRKLLIDHARIEPAEIDEAGEYDLEGLFVRLGYAVDQIGAKRIVLDTVEVLFGGFSNEGVLRAELRRLFDWIKDRGLTAIITAERGDGLLTRHGLEEYVSDCVVLLDNRVVEQITTRRLRIIKYRGSAHGADEYPFLIDACGISVLPITSSGVRWPVSSDIISSGIAGLDAMLRHGGFYRGSSLLLSGVAGTGKTLIGSQFIDAACRRQERCIFFVFEESADEICRNALSIGIHLRQWVDAGLLRFEAARPSLYGLEMHLARMNRDVGTFKPSVVVVDPISAFRGPEQVVHATLLRMVDLLKASGVTSLFTSLLSAEGTMQGTDQGLSSLMDSWIRLSDIEESGERNRILYIIKSRGSSHSNQMREYMMTDTGIVLMDAYIGSKGVLTGTARVMQEARDQAEADLRGQEIGRRRREIDRRRAELERKIAELRANLELEEDEAQKLLAEEEEREAAWVRQRSIIGTRRGVAK